MNAMLKIAKLNALGRRPSAIVLALPRQVRASTQSISEAARRWIVIAAIAVALAAAVAYIAAINMILFAGEAMKRDRLALSALEQEAGALAGILASRESPAWLEERARTNGMVDALGVRFLRSTDRVALSGLTVQ